MRTFEAILEHALQRLAERYEMIGAIFDWLRGDFQQVQYPWENTKQC